VIEVPIINTTWYQIDNPESVGWSLEKSNPAYEFSLGIGFMY
jgi:hypothetical protein